MYIPPKSLILQGKDYFPVTKESHDPRLPDHLLQLQRVQDYANPLLSARWCQMSGNIVHRHSPAHYPGRSTFHGSPISLVRWVLSWSRESAQLSSILLLHLLSPPHVSASLPPLLLASNPVNTGFSYDLTSFMLCRDTRCAWGGKLFSH